MTRELLLFGGSFNPVHNAHVAIAEYAHAQHPAAQIFVVPCGTHPFGKSLAPFADRVAMCRLAFAQSAYVTVSALEGARSGPSFTADTVRSVQQQYPQATIALIIGSDAVADLAHWHDAVWLQTHVPLIVIPRGPQGIVPDISSSEIRARCLRGEAVARLVPPSVVPYLRTHCLYQASGNS